MAASPLEEYSSAPVPGHRLVPGWRLALIVATFSISLPTFLSSASIALPIGLYGALLATLVAGVILSVGGCFTSIVSVHSRLTTYLLVQRSFGLSGAALVNLVIAVVHFGWFGVNVSFFAGAMVAAVHDIYGLDADFNLFVVAGSLLIALSTVFGFRTLDRLAWVAIPLLSAILIGVCAMAVRENGLVVVPLPNPPLEMSFGTAVSAIVGGNILVIAAMPDLSRYVRTTGQAVQSMALSLPVALTLMMLVSAIPALAMGETDIMRLIVHFGFGAPALAMLVFSIWTINAANLYSASLALSATFPAVRPWVFTIIGGVVGGALALVGIINAFVPFLLLLGMIIPPIAAIYVIDGLTIFRRVDAAASIRNLCAVRWPAIGVWIGSVAIALLAEGGIITLTTVPALDASIVATVAYLVVRRLELKGNGSRA